MHSATRPDECPTSVTTEVGHWHYFSNNLNPIPLLDQSVARYVGLALSKMKSFIDLSDDYILRLLEKTVELVTPDKWGARI